MHTMHTRISHVRLATPSRWLVNDESPTHPVDGTLCLWLHHEGSQGNTTQVWINPDALDHLAVLVHDAIDRRTRWAQDCGYSALSAIGTSIRKTMMPENALASPAD